MKYRHILLGVALPAVAVDTACAQSCLGVSTTHAYRSSIGFGAAFTTAAKGYYARLGADRGRVFGAIIGGLVDMDVVPTKAKVVGVDIGTTIALAGSPRVQLCPFLQGRYQRSEYSAASVAFQRSAPEVLHETALA